MKSSNGITLLETLVSILLLFFIITLVLPQLYFISIERRNLKLENFAMKTLNEELFEHSIRKDSDSNKVTLFSGKPYFIEIKLNEADLDRPIYEGCIQWKNLLEQEQIKCGSVK